MRFLYFFLFLFCLDVSAEEYVRANKKINAKLVKNASINVTIYKGEIFEKEDDTHIKYGKDKIKINPTDVEAYGIGDVQSEYLKNQNNYITAIENNPNNWQFDFSTIKKPNDRPVYVYKKNGTGKKEIFENDDVLVFDKNGLGEMFRIAIKNVPSIVYYRADVEKILKGESVADTITKKPLNHGTDSTLIDSLRKENTRLKSKLTNKDAEIQGLKGEITKKNTEIEQKFENVDFNTWFGNKYSWLAIIFSVTFIILVIILQISANEKSKKIKNLEDDVEEKNKLIEEFREEIEEKNKLIEKLKEGEQPDKAAGAAGSNKLTSKEGIEKIVEKLELLLNEKFTEAEKNIKSNEKNLKNITTTLSDLKTDNQTQNNKLSEIISKIGKLEPQKPKSSATSSAQTSTKKNPSTGTGDYQSFVQAAKAILALLDETVEELKQKSNSSIENKIIKKFEGKKGLFNKTNNEQKQRKRWQEIIDELEKNNRIVDEDLKNELSNSSDKLDKIHELFFDEYLQQYINKTLILIEEFKNLNFFTTKKVENATNQNLKNQINQVIRNAKDYFGITIHYTPLFLKPKLDFEHLEFGNTSILTEYYKPILAANIRKGAVVEIKHFGMEGKYQKRDSRKKTKIIAK